jgi:endonuclease/exonuclease/phosphatase family metal-dependent hydrolase
MSRPLEGIRVVTYNIHKCRGLDQRRSPQRIARVLAEVDADLIALQEVVNDSSGKLEREQARYLASSLGLQHYCFEQARPLRGSPYGNAVLSRYPIWASYNHNISWKRQEPRACLRVDLAINGRLALHVFNVHLGTSPWERKAQAQMLVSSEILSNPQLTQPRIMLGDFNEWMLGSPSRLLANHLVSADLRIHLQRSRTYPGLFPFVHLDHIYFDETLHLECLSLHKSRTAMMASDHLPLVANLRRKESPVHQESKGSSVPRMAHELPDQRLGE